MSSASGQACRKATRSTASSAGDVHPKGNPPADKKHSRKQRQKNPSLKPLSCCDAQIAPNFTIRALEQGGVVCAELDLIGQVLDKDCRGKNLPNDLYSLPKPLRLQLTRPLQRRDLLLPQWL